MLPGDRSASWLLSAPPWASAVQPGVQPQPGTDPALAPEQPRQSFTLWSRWHTHKHSHTFPFPDAHLYNPLEKIWKILRIRTVTRSRCCSLFTILCVCVFIIWSFSKWITCNSFLTKFVFKVLMYTSVCNLNGGKSKLFTGNLYKCMPS